LTLTPIVRKVEGPERVSELGWAIEWLHDGSTILPIGGGSQDVGRVAEGVDRGEVLSATGGLRCGLLVRQP